MFCRAVADECLTHSDDPWNQTAADNPEWLMRFKRDVGLLPQDSGPGLGLGYFVAPRPR